MTGSTLNGRKGHLDAPEGDKDRWDFLNFASAWTPSEKVLPVEPNLGHVHDDVFFTQVSRRTSNDDGVTSITQQKPKCSFPSVSGTSSTTFAASSPRPAARRGRGSGWMKATYLLHLALRRRTRGPRG